MARPEKTIRAEVDEDVKKKVQDMAKQQRKTERQIIIKSVNLLWDSTIKK